jgi:hypothetical protein
MSFPPMKPRARIYRPAKPPTQSGTGNRDWHLEFEPTHRETPDHLMGWQGGGDVEGQVILHFRSSEEAVRYATENGLDYVVQPEAKPTLKIKTYADNFRFDRGNAPPYSH